MKIYISADIEGVAGIVAPAETALDKVADSMPFREQMSDEVGAACHGAFAAGAAEIVIKDAHGTGRNILPRRLPSPSGKSMQLIRGWSGHPFAMVQGIDASFAMAAFVGFHSAAGSGGNPLAHTVSGASFARVELNGVRASEFHLYSLAAATVGVPVGFLSGDQALCDDAKEWIDGIVTVPTLQGFGASVLSILPDEATRRIQEGVQRAVEARRPCTLAVPKDLAFKLTFVRPADAYAKSFYPGARQLSDVEVVLETTRYLDVLTFLRFAKT